MPSTQEAENLKRQQRAANHLSLAAQELSLLSNGAYRQSAPGGFALTPAEIESFDIARALRSLADPAERHNAPLEAEVAGRAMECGLLRQAGAFVPFEVLARDLTVGTANAGGNLVGKDIAPAAAWLRPGSSVLQAGATSIEGLRDAIAIPRFTLGGTVQMVTENGAAAESNPTFDQVVLTPKTATAYVDYSRRLGLQVAGKIGGIRGIIAADLGEALAAMVDLMALTGTGTGNEPRGLMNTAGIASVPLGANGGAITWAAVTNLEYEVGAFNGTFGSLGYVTNPKVKRQLQQTAILTSGTPIWMRQDGLEAIAGTPAWSTANLPSNLVKGSAVNCSPLLYGNWAQLVIGTWGQGVEMMVDPYSQSPTGAVRVVAMLDFDIAVRRIQAFAAIVDAVAP
jgi:HK97 family phage major capsid protein